MKLIMTAKSDVGVARSTNEDFCGIFEEDGLAVVCDGMGGHQAGAKASRLAIATLRYMYLFLNPATHAQIATDLSSNGLQIATRLVGSIRLSNRNIYNKSLQEPSLKGMGTTVSALTIIDGTAIIAHVGDSRIYRFRNNKMEQLTEDHTWVNELIQDRELNRDEARKFEKQNVITRALGLSRTVKIDLTIESVMEGDLYLLCTDGLTKALSDEEIKRIIFFNKNNFEHALQHLIDTANMKDGSDNITVALVAIDGAPLTQRSYPASRVTLKAEDEKISRLEDRILKRELSRQDNHRSRWERGAHILINRPGRAAAVILSSILVLLIGLFSATRQKNMPAAAESVAQAAPTITPQHQNAPAEVIEHQIEWQLENIVPRRAELDSGRIPGSKTPGAPPENKLMSTLLRTRSLQRNLTNQGIIYFIGFEKMKDFDRSVLYVNNKIWGKTSEFSERGLKLPPGMYQISVRDSSNVVLYDSAEISIQSGDIKPIEFRRR
ncbi:MAG: Stp1/IreP family PP2C-type Ser/Thr phosphatase [candidate division KSB1 bacterium]|nr:Stp1/IreP family PP2C-type Ser/Thr phosphatase [candidate division KSB1 bacterium]